MLVGEYMAKLHPLRMPPKMCTVSFVDGRGLRHTVELTASLSESVAAALFVFRKNGWLEDQPGR
jgi:hypothetical protein